MLVQLAATYLHGKYIKSRFHYTPNEWPPYHPKHYTTLTLIHHKGKSINAEVISIAEGLVTKGNISKSQPSSSNIGYHSKDISELFPSNLVSSYFLLIEGAPGIGKTVLSKEIAYQWANQKLLKFSKLTFLLFLQDPNIIHLKSIKSLAQYLLNFSTTEAATGLSEFLLQSQGEGLTIILDGYDEMSEEDRYDSLIARIISRNILPQCYLVITSRPSASLCLRDMADCRVEVLGFTEEDRLDYIQHALEGSNYKIEALKLYLQSNSTINALCYVPLNMTILLCLFEEVTDISDNVKFLTLDHIEEIGLPNTQTEMYEKFILMTIIRFIKKKGKPFTVKCMKISELPKPYNEAFNELSCLAYNALAKDEIVFNSKDSVVQACPILKSGNWEGLGLLKVIHYTTNVSFHFLHFSIQEYLAAYYISLQSQNFRVQLLKDTFWNIHYFNTWIMYLGITGGKQFAWKHFISGNLFMFSTMVFRSSKIARKYLNDKIKSLHLFQCFAEIGSKELVKVFKGETIDLSNQTLLPKDINTICFFLLRSINKHWIKLDLSSCNIGDTGSDILCKTFLGKNRDILNIDRVDLCDNQLKLNSILGLLGVFKAWHTSEAVLSGSYDNASNLFELCVEKFTSLIDEKDFTQTVLIGSFLFALNSNVHNLLENSTNITGLYLNNCSFPHIYNYKLTLSKLHIISENMDSYLIGTIVQSINEVDGVYIYDHTLSDEDVKYISLMLHKVHLSSLGVWMVIGRTKILGNLPDIPSLNKQLSPLEILNLAESIKILCSGSRASLTKFSKCGLSESKSSCAYFFHLLHKYISKCEINFCLAENNILISNGVNYDKISNVLSSNSSLIAIFLRKCKLNETELEELTDTISKQESLEKICIFDSSLKMHNFNFENFLNQTSKLKELFIHNTDSSYPLCFDLHNAQRNYPNISLLLIASDTLVGLYPSSEQLLLSSQLETWNFPADVELCQQMINSLSTVEELDIPRKFCRYLCTLPMYVYS